MKHRRILTAGVGAVALLAIGGEVLAQSYFFRWQMPGATSTTDPYAGSETSGTGGGTGSGSSEPSAGLTVVAAVAPAATVWTGGLLTGDYDASGGTSPYSWAVASAPAGMTIDTQGVVVWYPSAAGTFTGMAAEATDAAGLKASSSPFDVVVKDLTRQSFTGNLSSQTGRSVAVDGEYMVAGAPMDDTVCTDCGLAYVYRKSASGWSLAATLQAGDAAGKEEFGISVAIKGDTIVVGARQDDAKSEPTTDAILMGAGAAYVFQGSGGTWSQKQKLVASDAHDPAGNSNKIYFGQSVAVDGGTVVVGAQQGRSDFSSTSNYYGAAYVFTGLPGTYSQTHKFLGSTNNGYFGESVAVSGDVMVVGAPGEDGDNGAAHVFHKASGGWGKVATFGPDSMYGWFGRSVSIDAGRIVVGSPYEDVKALADGAVYVFEGSAAVWGRTARFPAEDAVSYASFGESVATRNGMILVGAAGADVRSAYIYQGSGNKWKRTAKVSDSTVHGFGGSVSTDGISFAVGGDGTASVYTAN